MSGEKTRCRDLLRPAGVFHCDPAAFRRPISGWRAATPRRISMPPRKGRGPSEVPFFLPLDVNVGLSSGCDPPVVETGGRDVGVPRAIPAPWRCRPCGRVHWSPRWRASECTHSPFTGSSARSNPSGVRPFAAWPKERALSLKGLHAGHGRNLRDLSTITYRVLVFQSAKEF